MRWTSCSIRDRPGRTATATNSAGTDLAGMATGFLNLDDHDVMMFSGGLGGPPRSTASLTGRRADEEAGGIPTQQHWAQDEPDVDWDWATQAHPSGKAMSAPDSGWIPCRLSQSTCL